MLVYDAVVSHVYRLFIAALWHGGSDIQGVPGSHTGSECSYSWSCRLDCAARWGCRVFAGTGNHQGWQWRLEQDLQSRDKFVVLVARDLCNPFHRFRGEHLWFDDRWAWAMEHSLRRLILSQHVSNTGWR
jgi:hypothetical protein